MKNVLIVGNGFDLNLHYKTTYDDYLNYVGNRGTYNDLHTFFFKARNRGLFLDKNWNSFEKGICQLLNSIEYIFNNISKVTKKEFFEDYYGNKKVKMVVLKIKYFHEIPYEYKKALECGLGSKIATFSSTLDGDNSLDFLDENKLINNEVYLKISVNLEEDEISYSKLKELLLNDIEKELKDVEDDLQRYISNVILPLSNLIPIERIDKILSFNYSNTAQTLFNLNDDDVVYIHGKIGSGAVIGIEDKMIPGQLFTINSMFSIFYKKKRRSFAGFNKGLNTKVLDLIDNDTIVTVYGHSFDSSDKSVLTKIFETKPKLFKIYFYKDKQKIQENIMDLLGIDRYEDMLESDKISLIPAKGNFDLFNVVKN